MIIDTHCDTATMIYDTKAELYKNRFHLDISRMKNYDGYCQFFACCATDKEYALSVIDYLVEQIEKNEEHIMLVKNYNEFSAAVYNGKLAAFLSLEGAEQIENLNDVCLFYEKGVRMISLTWNYDNKYATGVLGDKNGGVTELGKKLIHKMNKLGILCDVSHLNEKSFWEITELVKFPLIASHSNSKSVCNNARNLTDEQFGTIRDSGGYVGINMYPPFLSENKKANISDILKHIEYFLSLGGEDVIGLGCDFDGVDCLPDGIDGMCDIYKIFNEMIKFGYKEELIHKIAHKNFEKIIKLF